MAKRKMSDLHENLTAFHDHGLWIPSRTIYLELGGGDDAELNHETAAKFIKNFTVLETLDSTAEIRVYINCPGGSVIDGMAMFDVVKGSSCDTVGVVMGEASSMAAILLQAFTRRQAFPYARILLHDGIDSQSGNVRDIEKSIEWGRKQRAEDYRILAERTGKDPSYWRKKLACDYILSASEALEERLIDEIL